MVEEESEWLHSNVKVGVGGCHNHPSRKLLFFVRHMHAGLTARQCIAGGVAAIVISTHGKSSQQPKALGGSANETSSSIPIKSTATSRLPVTGRPQITPTHTVARRDGSSPTATSIHIHRRQLPDHPRYHRRRLGDTLSV